MKTLDAVCYDEESVTDPAGVLGAMEHSTERFDVLGAAAREFETRRKVLLPFFCRTSAPVSTAPAPVRRAMRGTVMLRGGNQHRSGVRMFAVGRIQTGATV